MTAVSGLPVIAALLAIPVVAVAVRHPESADAWAVVGAVFASVLSLIEARARGRALGHTISVFLGCAIVGSIAPGILYNIFLWKEWLPANADTLFTWHVWAGAGLFCGLQGWLIIRQSQRFGSWCIESWLTRRLSKRYGFPPDKSDSNPD